MKVQKEYYPSGNLQRIIYFQDGQIHREGEPAVIEYDDDGETVRRILFYKHNKLHRRHLAAIIRYHGNDPKEIEFYEEGVKIEDTPFRSIYRMMGAVLGGDPEALLGVSPDNSKSNETKGNRSTDESDTTSISSEG
jgi:hypothetical protein